MLLVEAEVFHGGNCRGSGVPMPLRLLYPSVLQGFTAKRVGLQKSLPQLMSSSAQAIMIEFAGRHL
jgi:hypothetical protein